MPSLVCPVRGSRADSPPRETELRAPGAARRTGSRGGGGRLWGAFPDPGSRGPRGAAPPPEAGQPPPGSGDTSGKKHQVSPHGHCYPTLGVAVQLWDVYQHSWPPGTNVTSIPTPAQRGHCQCPLGAKSSPPESHWFKLP